MQGSSQSFSIEILALQQDQSVNSVNVRVYTPLVETPTGGINQQINLVPSAPQRVTIPRNFRMDGPGIFENTVVIETQLNQLISGKNVCLLESSRFLNPKKEVKYLKLQKGYIIWLWKKT